MNILVSALENSSNNHLKALLPYLGDVKLSGIFESNSLGKPLYEPSVMAIMGFVDVLYKIPFFIKAKRQMIALAKDVDVVLLMDSSAFNMPLAKAIKRKYKDKKIIYYILPQLWAWKPWRAKELELTCDILVGILPFEESSYKNKKPIYIGNPLLDEIPLIKKQSSEHKNKIVFMPGSRKGEIKRLLPYFKEVAKKIDEEKVIVIPKHFIGKESEIYGDISEFTISFDSYTSLYEARFAFICSGTATLESALIGTPFVLAYQGKSLDAFIVKLFLNLKYVGLANIFADKMNIEKIHEELLQENVSVDNLRDSYMNFDKEKFIQNAIILRKYLQSGCSEELAKLILRQS